MGVVKYVDFDYYLSQVKADGKERLLRKIVHEISRQSSVSEGLLNEIFAQRALHDGISVENGLAIFDVTSRFIKNPIAVIATLEKGMDVKAADNKPVDLFIGVISPANNVSAHLQRLSSVARLFRSQDLRKALRDTRSADEMKVLFMPTQDWMVAA